MYIYSMIILKLIVTAGMCQMYVTNTQHYKQFDVLNHEDVRCQLLWDLSVCR